MQRSSSALALSPDRQAAYQRHAEICKVLTDPKRLMILDALRAEELSVGQLAELLGASLANVSQHLGVLRSAALVGTRRSGTTVRYRLTEPRIAEACDIIDAIVGSRGAPGGRVGSADSDLSTAS
ncbi:MAG: metalloregulator ArsR/SmtB family transcription factor [Candidatus Dormiibacterota bacterium]